MSYYAFFCKLPVFHVIPETSVNSPAALYDSLKEGTCRRVVELGCFFYKLLKCGLEPVSLLMYSKSRRRDCKGFSQMSKCRLS